MDQDQFWRIVSQACRSDPNRSMKWDAQLQAELKKLPPDEIIEWNHIFDRLAARAYTVLCTTVSAPVAWTVRFGQLWRRLRGYFMLTPA